MKKSKFISPIPLEERKRAFDVKHRQLERRRQELEARIKQEETEARREAQTAEAKRRAKKFAKKLAYDTKYIYVAGGHFKNEALGFCTVFNLGRSTKVRTTRLVKYDDSDKLLYLDIIQRKDRDMSKRAKVFVYIHGGGWIGGAPATREAFTSKVAEAGYFVASLWYGDGPRYSHPKMIENVYKAFAWLKAHAEDYNIDTDEIFVGGESAGGHLSAMAGAISSNPQYRAGFDLDERARDQRIAGLVLNCGVYDLEKAVSTGFKNIGIYTQSYCGGTSVAELDEKTRKEISPIYWVTEDFPPTYAISAENDKLAVLTFDLVKKLYDLGVYVEHYHGEGKWAVHAFAVSQGFEISREAMRGTVNFLRNRCDMLSAQEKK